MSAPKKAPAKSKAKPGASAKAANYAPVRGKKEASSTVGHPEYKEIVVTCACGTTFTTRSTRSTNLGIDVCSKCHPFYTGKQKVMDIAGKVEKFNTKYSKILKPSASAPAAKE